VLGQRKLKPWQVFLAVKWMELCFHLRPARLREILRTRDRDRRYQLLWSMRHTGMVWAAEVIEFARVAVGRAMKKRSAADARGLTRIETRVKVRTATDGARMNTDKKTQLAVSLVNPLH
jgi:hypothetical protein